MFYLQINGVFFLGRGQSIVTSYSRGSDFLGQNRVTSFMDGPSDWQALKRRSLAIEGSGEPPTLLGAFRCEWNPFLNSVDIIFNSTYQTGKRRRRSPSLLGGGGGLGGAFRSIWV